MLLCALELLCICTVFSFCCFMAFFCASSLSPYPGRLELSEVLLDCGLDPNGLDATLGMYLDSCWEVLIWHKGTPCHSSLCSAIDVYLLVCTATCHSPTCALYDNCTFAICRHDQVNCERSHQPLPPCYLTRHACQCECVHDHMYSVGCGVDSNYR